MASIAASVEIARSPEDVFAYITDVSRHPEWQEGLVSAALEGEGPVRVGSRVVHKRKLGPTTVATTSEITAFNPPEVVSFKGLDGPIRAEGSQRVERVGEGSRVSFEMEMRGHGLGVLMLPMARKQAERQVASSHEKLKRTLEGH
ncbi:MAG TPA: SRPBCC family protein [Solirubrobacteraceae bacterium]|nr:SRPBCC family protein [Solirubrobacteraceae bacterium]